MPVDRKPPVSNVSKPETRPAVLSSSQSTTLSDLDRLKQQLRDNERIWAGFRDIELAVIGAHSLRELLSALASRVPSAFSKVDTVTIACLDPEYEMARLLKSNIEPSVPNNDSAERAFVGISHASLQQLFGKENRPRLGSCSREVQTLLFPTFPRTLGSVALVPLVLRGKLIGTLNQGSVDAKHFTADTATDLLEHLAAIVSMCIENVVNHERLRIAGLTDPLTGIANRRFFERRLIEEIERWRRRQEPLVYMLADIDHFKQVNDRYGHHAGDQVLQQVASLLGDSLRGMDLLARYGGEEFMLLLPNTSAANGTMVAQRLCNKIARHSFSITDGQPLSVTISIGVACLGVEGAAAMEKSSVWLSQQADAALYQAKQAGRNRVVLAAG